MSEIYRKQLAGLHLKNDHTAVADAMPLGIVDRDREITLEVADAKVPLLQGHDWAQRPVGVADIRSDAKLARAPIQFLKTAAGEEAYQTVKQMHALGVEQAVSLGFIIDKARPPNDEERQRGAVRVLEKITPVELSLVVVGAVPGATIRNVKCAVCAAKGDGPCGCASKVPDPAEVTQLVADVRRTLRRGDRVLAMQDALKEPQGALALDAVAKAVRWLTGGREHEPPVVKFMDYNGKEAGRYDPGDPDAIYISRGLDDRRLIEVLAHETQHWLCPWDAGEAEPIRAGEYVLRRYLESLEN